MYTTPLLGRVVALHQQNLRTEVARDRDGKTAMAGTRTRGGFIQLATRARRPERDQARAWRSRPAVA